MVKEKKKIFKTRSIFLPEEDFKLDKEVNEIAKKDSYFDKDNLKSKDNMLSIVTRSLWKLYVASFQKEEKETILKYLEDENEPNTA